jgi:hypothetical protein
MAFPALVSALASELTGNGGKSQQGFYVEAGLDVTPLMVLVAVSRP